MPHFIVIANFIILVYFLILAIGYTLLLIASFPGIMRSNLEAKYGHINKLLGTIEPPPVTIIMPAYNEGEAAFDAMLSVLKNTYQNTKLIVINDGSTDNTLELMIERFHLEAIPCIVPEKIKTAAIKNYYISRLYPQLVVLDTEHSHTGDSMNSAINACQSPYFASVDADTLLEKEAISNLMYSVLTQPHCVCVGGSVYVLNDCEFKDGEFIEQHIPEHFVAAIQVCEYLRSFLFARSGWNFLNGSLSFAGAFTLFERQAALDIGGYDLNNFAQDAEIVMHLHAHIYENKLPAKIRFTPNLLAWTDVPDTFGSYWNQRNHWQRGLLYSILSYFRMCFNPRYKITGLVTYPYFLLFEVLSPLFEFTAYTLLVVELIYGYTTLHNAALYFALAWSFITALTIGTFLLSNLSFNRYYKLQDTLIIFLLITVEMFGFRQFKVVCRCFGIGHFIINRLLGKKL